MADTSRLAELNRLIQQADANQEFGQLNELRELQRQELRKASRQDRSGAREERTGIRKEQLEVLAPIAESILKNSQTDAEADQIYQSIRQSLSQRVQGVELPPNVTRPLLQSFAAAAGRELGVTANQLREQQLTRRRQEDAEQRREDIRTSEEIGREQFEIFGGASSRAVEEAEKEEQERVEKGGSRFSGDPNALLRVKRRQLDFLSRLDTKEAKAKQVELGLELAEIEEELGIEPNESQSPFPKITPISKEGRRVNEREDSRILKTLAEDNKALSSLDDAEKLFRKGMGLVGTGKLTKAASEGLPPIFGVNVDAPLEAVMRRLAFTKSQREGIDLINAAGNAVARSLRSELPGILSDNDIAFLKSSSPSIGKEEAANKVLLDLLRASKVMGELKSEFFTEFRSKHGSFTSPDGRSAADEFRKFKDSTNFTRKAGTAPGVLAAPIDKVKLKEDLFSRL